MALTVALASTVALVWVLGSSGGLFSAEAAGQGSKAPPPAVPSAGTAYLGAFVDPAGTALSANDPTGGTASLPAELAALPAFNQQAGRVPSVLSTFQDWSEPVNVAGLDRVAATGAIPMVTWDCGDTDASVAAGLDDATVTAEAQSLAATDVPILLRWFPDPNATGVPATSACLGTGGASGFVAAYRHIHSLFEAAGATNVAFVWSVATSAGVDPNFASYYPGAGLVDWIAADGSPSPGARPQPAVYSPEFESWYATFSPAGKPMMISSAGADTGSQTAYFAQMLSVLPARYPAIRAFVYFDAPDVVTGDQYQLDAAGSASLRALAASPSFHPSRAQTVTTVMTSQSSVALGATLTLSASVDAEDNSGSVSFLDGGRVIRGCLFIPIRMAPSCQTSQLGAGTQRIVAVYGGDSAFSPSTSAPVTVAVVAAVAPVNGSSQGLSTTTSSTSPGPAVPPTSSAPAPTSSSAGAPRAQVQGPAVPASGQAYLGAFVDPTGQALTMANPTGGTYSLPIDVANAPSVDAGLARPLSITSIYLNWSNPVWITQIDQVWALGALPMITWNCGDSDWNVASGKDDALISAVAQKLAATHIPLFLRWYPDPNDQQSASAKSCLLNVPASRDPASVYRAAFQHIHDLFAAAGASNVAFVWSVDASQGQGSAAWDTYYPGSAFVDWIGADSSYSRATNVHDPFGSAFQPWYNEYSGSGKPLIVSSFGAVRGTQGQYLQDVANDLPTLFPKIKGHRLLRRPRPGECGPVRTERQRHRGL